MTLDINYLGIHGIYKIEYMNSYIYIYKKKMSYSNKYYLQAYTQANSGSNQNDKKSVMQYIYSKISGINVFDPIECTKKLPTKKEKWLPSFVALVWFSLNLKFEDFRFNDILTIFEFNSIQEFFDTINDCSINYK